MPRKKEIDEDPATTLARCIILLDDVRAYRRKDVDMIEDTFSRLKKSRGMKEFYDMWVKARPHAEKILDMPLKIEGVKKMIRTIAWFKVANRVGLIVAVLFVSLQIVPAWRRALGNQPLGQYGLLYTGIVVMAVVILLNLAAIWDYRIRKRVIKYEQETVDQYATARAKMKECIDKMMRALAREAEREGHHRDDYGMVLYFDDYDSIEVVKQWKPRVMIFFKKSYNHYQVVPKP